MRLRKVSISRLSREIDQPVSTLKKWFSARDGSLSRIGRVCRGLGIDLDYLVQQARKEDVKVVRFSERQQALFSKNFMTFSIYWLLIYERLKPSDIRERFRLSQKELTRILISLDKVDLIQFGAGETIKLPRMRAVKWQFDGIFMSKLFASWSSQVVLTDPGIGDMFVKILQYFQLTAQDKSEFEREVSELADKYARLTIVGLNSGSEPLIRFRFLASARFGGFM